MSIGTSTQIYVTGNSSAYLLERPATISGTTNQEKLKTAYGMFYEDGSIRKALKTGVTKWATLKEGISLSVKGKEIEAKPQGLGKVIVGYDNMEAELSGSFYDIDAEHFATMFSSSLSLSTPAGTGQAKKTDVGVGSATVPGKYMLLLEIPSVEFPGEFNHFLFTNVVFAQETKMSFKDGETLEMDFKLNVQYDSNFIDPVTHKAVLYWFGDTVGAATV